jgi:hypothetical protein
MVALYKLLITLTSLILLLGTDFVDSTWDDAEGGSISVPSDTLSWFQVSTCDNFRSCQLHLTIGNVLYSLLSSIFSLGFNLFFVLSNIRLLVSVCIHIHTNKQTPVNNGFKLVVLSYMSPIWSLVSAVASNIYHSGAQNLHVSVVPFSVVLSNCSCHGMSWWMQALSYPGIFLGVGSTNSVKDRGQREWGSGGCSPLVKVSNQIANK